MITHNHGPKTHSHAHGDFPHSHVLRAVCQRTECYGAETHNIHVSAPGTSVKPPQQVPEHA
jgi:hypothetical protein